MKMRVGAKTVCECTETVEKVEEKSRSSRAPVAGS